MHPLGNKTSRHPGAPRRGTRLLFGKSGGIGMTVLALVFLVALVFAANESTVLGWFIAVVAFGWLLLATFLFIGVQRAARFGAAQMTQAQQAFQSATGTAPPASQGKGGGTRLVNEGRSRADGIRDQKLEHSFKIVQVQAKVIQENLGTDETVVARALETIEITAHNGIGMLKDDDGGTVPGVVVD